MMVRGCWGAYERAERQGTGSESGSESKIARAITARGLERKRQGQRTLSAKVKNRPFSAYQIYRPRGVLSGAHVPRALTAGEMLAHWQAGPTTTAVAA
jgi:hypothetical protein